MEFSSLARQPDEQIDVLRGALLVARDEYPAIDVEREIARMDELATPLGSLAGMGAGEQAAVLSEHLFGVHSFRGNHDDYYDPKNSYLNTVLDRKLGIPITLSLVYVEVARRAGVSAHGVAFPKHFLVRIETESGDPLLVDPFGGGRVVGQGTLESWLDRGARAPKSLRPLLVAASPRAVLLRLLTNLKGVYATRGDLSKLLVVISRMLELSPDSADDLRDRAFVAMRLGVPRVAEGDFRRYLDLCPEAGDVAEVRRLLVKLGGTMPAIH